MCIGSVIDFKDSSFKFVALSYFFSLLLLFRQCDGIQDELVEFCAIKSELIPQFVERYLVSMNHIVNSFRC